ncbi:nucleotidyl transferase AbiEii/AbiGii toxin family protein [uncultured Cetobacterium sp.]|uniref:nucleotidyl transferase AbiEii/AbiGii toxin family protein n=1 Tax=uncultured Cetobacterium sp. TaxID=527638 RepID=UPI0025D123F8|nr:nucleotidyl transferase AbiEii/AbiGii toxin family protein [uncultured Cetobacterium sp.]
MKLHENKNDFRTLIQLTADFFNITPVYIEKDYWVTYVLKNLFTSEYKDKVIFKGGTSLSKAYSLIERFSEDVDLQLINFEGSENKKKNLMKAIEVVATTGLAPQTNHPRESKSGNIRKTVYKYTKVFNGEYFQASDDFIFEINGMSIPEPWEAKQIKSDISKYLLENGMDDVVAEFNLESFEVNVLNKERTFVEKIFAVLDYSFEDNYIEELGNKIRHIYDIHKLYNDNDVRVVFESDRFFELASKVVVENDFFGKRKDTIYSKSRFFSEDIISPLEATYKNIFSKFVYSSLPEFEDVKKDLEVVIERIKVWEKEIRFK